MRCFESGLVHRPLERVGQEIVSHPAVERRPARMSDERRREHLVMALEVRKHQIPGSPAIDEAVDQQQRRPAATAVKGGEAGQVKGVGAA